MKKYVLFFTMLSNICLAADGVIVDAYSEKPIEIECAFTVMKKIELLKKVELVKNAIIFEGKDFNGELYHGGENEPFTTFGIEVVTDNKKSIRELKITDIIVSDITKVCGR